MDLGSIQEKFLELVALKRHGEGLCCTSQDRGGPELGFGHHLERGRFLLQWPLYHQVSPVLHPLAEFLNLSATQAGPNRLH